VLQWSPHGGRGEEIGERIKIRGVTCKSKAHVKSFMDDGIFQIDIGGLDYLLLKLKTENL
jgi:hypothetical protein